jgi:nucleoside-diphosphate-sugar epimerase
VLVTGAAGLIGRYAIAPLREAGFAVHAVSRSRREGGGAVWHRADLLREADRERLFAAVRPDRLLHFAWDMRPGACLEDNANFAWLAASLELLRLFREGGGRRAVLAGTCFEYGPSAEPLAESSPVAPGTTYGRVKDHLNRLAALYCANNDVSYGWGRIFYVYGAGERSGRLTPDLITSLRRGEPFIVKNGHLVRDYLYAGDVAAAFVKFLAGEVRGEVNVCSGRGVALEDYCRRLARKLGREELLSFAAPAAGQAPRVVGDGRLLRGAVGFEPGHGLDDGLDALLADDERAWR